MVGAWPLCPIHVTLLIQTIDGRIVCASLACVCVCVSGSPLVDIANFVSKVGLELGSRNNRRVGFH